MNIVVWKSPKALRGILRKLFHIKHNRKRQFIGWDMNCRERKEAFMELELKKACLDAYETGGDWY